MYPKALIKNTQEIIEYICLKYFNYENNIIIQQ